MIRFIHILIIVLFFSVKIHAQDIHVSQYFNSPIHINPAMTGDFNGKGRCIVNHRNQWRSISVNPYKTFIISSDFSLLDKKLAFGINLLSDKSGQSDLSISQADASLATNIRLNKYNYVRFGADGAFTQRYRDLSSLSWNSQYDGVFINTDIPSGETSIYKHSFFDASMGMQWKHIFKNKTTLNIGQAAYHINRPIYNTIEPYEILPIRWTTFADVSIKTQNEQITLYPSILYMKQGAISEFNIGLFTKHKLGMQSIYTGFNHYSFAYYGIYYRFNDAIIPYIKYEYLSKYAFGLSYDINVSKLTSATKARGGKEISFIYFIR